MPSCGTAHARLLPGSADARLTAVNVIKAATELGCKIGWGLRMSNSRIFWLGISVAFAFVAQQVAHSGEAKPASPAVVAKGRALYQDHCAVCHGLDGQGQGPLTAAMKIIPADLTRISNKHGGTFPKAKIADVIRNGGNVLGHGSSAMLPWGVYFSERRKPEVGKARIKALVAYIKSLQGTP